MFSLAGALQSYHPTFMLKRMGTIPKSTLFLSFSLSGFAGIREPHVSSTLGDSLRRTYRPMCVRSGGLITLDGPAPLLSTMRCSRA